MDGVGFPYLSPTCYWYIVEGEERAFQFVEGGDVGADVFIFSCCFLSQSQLFLFYFYIIIIFKEPMCTNRCEFGIGTGIHFEHSADLWIYHFINIICLQLAF